MNTVLEQTAISNTSLAMILKLNTVLEQTNASLAMILKLHSLYTLYWCVQAQEWRAEQRRKLEEHTMRARKINVMEPSGQTERPRFIMKRCAQ